MFKALHGTDYLRLNPMVLMKTGKPRRLDKTRANNGPSPPWAGRDTASRGSIHERPGFRRLRRKWPLPLPCPCTASALHLAIIKHLTRNPCENSV